MNLFSKPILLFALTLLGVLISSCREGSGGANTIEHPLAVALPHTALGDSTIALTLREEGPPHLQALAQMVEEADLVREVGTLDGSPETVWGQVRDIATDARGRHYVLDGYYSDIRVFDDSAELVTTFGQHGGGPVEFINPQALAIGPEGQVVVATRGSGTKIFQPRGQEGVELVHSLSEIVGDDACIIGDTAFLRGRVALTSYSDSVRAQALIHAYSIRDGSWIRSFGLGYSYHNPLVRRRLSQGGLACASSPATVLLTFDMLPYLLAYGTDGTLRWKGHVKDFSPAFMQEFFEGDQSGFRVRIRTGTHRVLSVVSLKNNFLLQVIRFGKESETNPGSFSSDRRDTYLVSAATGDYAWLGTQVPWVIAATENMLFAHGGREYPAIAHYRLD